MSLREGRQGYLMQRAGCGGSGMSSSRGLGRRLVGVRAPAVELPFALDALVSLAKLARRRSLVVFFYPGMDQGRCGEQEDVDTARVSGWCEHESELGELGYMVVGVSSQSPSVQGQFASDELLGYMLLSDSELELARELGLPTRRVAGERVYEPLTVVVEHGRIARVFYPVDSAHDAETVMDWIRRVRA